MNTINGAIITDFGSYDTGRYVFAQPDGKITVLGITSGVNGDDIAIAHYNSNGSLDTTFDGDGKLIATSVMSIYNMQLVNDGKFLTVGQNGNDFTVARYNSNGTLDNGFSGDGKLVTILTGSDAAMDSAIQADGKIVVVGFDENTWKKGVVRYNSDGSLDTSFNNNGVAVNNNVTYTAYHSVTVQLDGKVVVGGEAHYSGGYESSLASLFRFNRNGQLDTSFGSDGVVMNSTERATQFFDVDVLDDGKVLAAVDNRSDFTIIRYNPNGTIDTGFGDNGKVTTDLGGTETLSEIIPLAGDKFLAAGTDGNNNFLLARYNADGTLDAKFSSDGVVTTDLGGWEIGSDITVQADGKILLVGTTDNNIALVRYNPNGSLDKTFNSLTTINHTPTGTVTITGNAIKGQTLSATNTLADTDGLGAITYQWQANGVNLGTSNTLTLTSNEIGKTITAIAKYTDGLGNAESVTSPATASITDTSTTPPIATPVSGTAGVNIIGTDLITNEQGDSALFNVQLNSAPTRDVTLDFTSSDPSEGIITNPTLKFTSANWSTPQTFTVTGQNDSLVDGNIAYTINAKLTTLDVIYKSVDVNSVTLTNQDTPIAKVETINGGNGIDILHGTSAPSYILGEAGDDDLSGGAGNDTIYGSYGADLLFGEDGNDKLYGEQDADYIEGSAGNDTLDGGLGLDTLIGGAGDDTYYLGYDEVDVVDDQGLASDVDVVIMPYQLTKYTLPTGIENGTIAAGTTASNLTGNDGDNTLTGNDGKNTLDGAVGRDSLFGGAGNDALLGGDDNDTLNGGNGTDHLEGGSGNDSIDGGAGNDEIVGGSGAGDDIYIGGVGSDTIKYTSAITGINVDLALGKSSGNEINNDTLSGIENVVGGQAGDFLSGSVGKNALDGYTGNDTISGGAGKDKLTGGLGADRFKFNSETETGATGAARDIIADFNPHLTAFFIFSGYHYATKLCKNDNLLIYMLNNFCYFSFFFVVPFSYITLLCVRPPWVILAACI